MDYTITVLLVILAHKTFGNKCESPRLKNEPYNALFVNDIPSGQYVCPGEDDPPSHTECCWDGVCCPVTSDVSQSDWLLKIISLTVILFCLLIVAILLVSCFWGKGVCYQSCRAKYTAADVPMYTVADDDDPLRLMPRESNGSNHYTPGRIRVRMIEDV